MTFNPDIHHRKSIRLKGFDYSGAAAYFITICTLNREHLFGEIVDGVMCLNSMGDIVNDSWQWLAGQYTHVHLDQWIIMPDHLHGIIMIRDGMGGSRTAPTATNAKTKSIGRLVGAFKTVSTKNINRLRNTEGARLWQRNYWERIIRDDAELAQIRQYILDNPLRWSCRGGS